jgi:hypothetical protein
MSHKRSHKRHKRRSMKGGKNMVDKTVSVAKNTSRKYMPKIKSGLEDVGSKVVSTTSKSVPFLQNMTRKLFKMFGAGHSRRRRRH